MSHKYKDNRMNSAAALKTMIRHKTCQDREKLCLLFQQSFSMKSIVSWPLECNFSLCCFFFFFFVGLSSLLYEMVHSPVTLADIHSFFFRHSFAFFSQEAVLFFSHLASFHHSFSPEWRISSEAEACHSFPDLQPEDDMIEMISCSIYTHLPVLHSAPD